MSKLAIQDVDMTGKRVLMRCDFNVPLDEKGNVRDPLRIVNSLPSIRYVLRQKDVKSLVILSHFGRPKGKRNDKLSLKAVVPILEKYLNRTVIFLNNCVGPEVQAICANPAGSVILLENTRFHIEEEGKGTDVNGDTIKADPEKVVAFRNQLSKLGDVFINDAFGTSHRRHSSVCGLTVPIRAMGMLISKELKQLSQVLHNPPRPFVAILGGVKVRDKIPLVSAIIQRADDIIIGGGMAYTFLKTAHGVDIGSSIFDEPGSKRIQELMDSAAARGARIHLPVDFVCADKFDAHANIITCTAKSGIPQGWLGLDIGPRSCILNSKVLWKAKSIFMNGPLGVYEFPAFSGGTRSCLEASAAATALNGCISIIGGGDSAGACKQFGYDNAFTHISTGGGASLKLIEGAVLPGIACLTDKSEIRRPRM